MTETGSRDHCHYLQGVNQVHVALSESLLVTVLRNLLENAMRHGELGAPIEISVQESKRMAVIDITSQGDTIASEHLSRLTERFHQGDYPKRQWLGSFDRRGDCHPGRRPGDVRVWQWCCTKGDASIAFGLNRLGQGVSPPIMARSFSDEGAPITLCTSPLSS